MGWYPDIVSLKMKSNIPGSMHLHAPIPGVSPTYPEGTIQFVRLGTAEDYARKVYGDADRETGWDSYQRLIPSWKVQPMYDRLWEKFEDRIEHAEIGVSDMMALQVLAQGGETIISTLPQLYLCLHRQDHEFRSQAYWIEPLPVPPGDEGTEIVVYNGLPHDTWYRWSILGGKCSIESTQRLTSPNAIAGHKAISNTCDCWPNINRVGRWAEHRHGVLVHHAYGRTKEILNASA